MRRAAAAALVSLVAPVALVGCDDDPSTPEDGESTTEASSELLGCGMVDEELVVEAIGADATSIGTGVLPEDEAEVGVARCDITSVGQPDTYMTLRGRYPLPDELTEMKDTWPQSPAEIDGCSMPWVAPGDGQYGAACVDELPEGQATRLSSLWGDVTVNVVIARPEAKPDDAEIAYRISESVAEQMTQ
jgi:hypothetical protein